MLCLVPFVVIHWRLIWCLPSCYSDQMKCTRLIKMRIYLGLSIGWIIKCGNTMCHTFSMLANFLSVLFLFITRPVGTLLSAGELELVVVMPLVVKVPEQEDLGRADRTASLWSSLSRLVKLGRDARTFLIYFTTWQTWLTDQTITLTIVGVQSCFTFILMRKYQLQQL